jgi:hypothetical protein
VAFISLLVTAYQLHIVSKQLIAAEVYLIDDFALDCMAWSLRLWRRKADKVDLNTRILHTVLSRNADQQQRDGRKQTNNKCQQLKDDAG